ncbi:hypothetical protein NA56DRAFT_668580 [Hyaloscypha hepaticicola]|uniref:Btz domain-containing protein n=1 Tax=Hyaloscypha hepaticicola TaxID=2082293 RepID=A0A2J6QGH0_9HELO|nr:hypothetical protein NA56DRAFT_668580 [Hyaloscypha hepaticicola]
MGHRQRKDLAAIRRRVEDEGDEEGGPDLGDLDDDSLSEGSILSEEDDPQEGDEISTAGAAPAASPELSKVNGTGDKRSKGAQGTSTNGTADASKKPLTNGTSDMDMMLNGLKISDQSTTVEEVQYEDLRADDEVQEPSPAVVNSTAQMDQPQELPHERRRREHEEYKKKRDADPAFVPNRGAFFMHDHRHSGPAANGFRPFGRGRGRGRPGIGGPFAPSNQMGQTFEPTDAPWTHDMHEVISEPSPRNFQTSNYSNGASNLPSRVPISAPKSAPPNRALSTTKHVGNVQIRLFLSTMEKPIVFPSIPWKQYTRLPDHRPPLRRDKPVRISLPDHPPRYIFPAVDRSFIFIPRAMRPNQQGFGGRGRGRSILGSIGGYSRRTSVFGGSVYGSAYSPSVAMSRRSSLAREINRESIVSPTGSTMSRPQMTMDPSKPVVRLPPPTQSVQPQQVQPVEAEIQNGPPQVSTSIDDLPRPQTYPLPQKPTFRENRPNPIPMHQPRPQKAVSVADIESPATLSFNPPQQHQQPFHQQVPIQVNGNNYSHDTLLHSRNASYPSQGSTGTPLSQIPERAIHAQPFQPNPYQQQQTQNFYPQPYQVMQPQQGYYYPQSFNQSMAPSGGAPPFVPSQPQQQQGSFHQPGQPSDNAASQQGVQNLVAQELNGMVYYYDATQIPAVATFPSYQQPQSYPMQQVGGVMGGMLPMTPSPDGFYYPQPPQGVVYYPQ